MSASPPNLHRSFFALLLGNLIAIIGASVVALILCQLLFPKFYDEFVSRNRQRRAAEKKLQDEKASEKKEPQADGDGRDAAQADGKTPVKSDKPPLKQPSEKNGRDSDPEKTEPVELPPLVFPLGYLGILLLCDLAFAVLAGYVCVLTAGFAKHNHAMLLALFLAVWKVQQLLGTASNQIPPFLLTIEIVLVPFAAVLGATWAGEPEPDQEFDVDSGSPEDIDQEPTDKDAR